MKTNRLSASAHFVLGILAVLALACALAGSTRAEAQARYFELTLQGSYSTQQMDAQKSIRQSVGVELGLPINDYFEITFGHDVLAETTVYSDDYRQSLIAQHGIANLPATLTDVQTSNNTTADASLSYPFGSFAPGVFGGALYGRNCEKDIFESLSCSDYKVTWNAGASLRFRLTSALSFKVSARVSPSQTTVTHKYYDELLTCGLTWSH